MTNDEVKIVLDDLHDVQRVNSLSPDVFDAHADVFEDLFEAIIVDRLFKHFGIKPLHNATIFNGFAYDDKQGWVATFYEPYCVIKVDDILSNHFDQLEEFQKFSEKN